MASIKILLRNKPNREGKYPVVLKIIKDRKTKIITLNMDCLKQDWDITNHQFKRSTPNHLQRNRILLKLKDRALKILDDFSLNEEDFSLAQFENKFRGKQSNLTTVKQFFEEKIDDLIRAGRTGNARAYNGTITSLLKFTKQHDFKFKDVDASFLDKYETYLRSTGYNDGGISVRMRTLRALINDAIRKGIIEDKYYPFKSYRISKLKGKSIKKALTLEDIRKIENLDEIQNPHLAEAKRLFLFSYYTRGMNYHDMMMLTWHNIEQDKIIYIRSKTKGRFVIKIMLPVQEILKYYKATNQYSNYIFPILSGKHKTPMQIENRKSKMLKRFNSDLKKIGSLLEIKTTITSYVARHSYATNMKFLGVSTDIISESMGHKNPSVTQVYLKEFDTTIIDTANEKLLEEPNLGYVA